MFQAMEFAIRAGRFLSRRALETDDAGEERLASSGEN